MTIGIMAAAVAVALAGAVAGCAGHSFNESGVGQLTPGVSTESDAVRAIGEPISRLVDPRSGHSGLTWGYGGGFGNTRVLTISFDESGRMIRVIQQSRI
jgi:hypothetical protein